MRKLLALTTLFAAGALGFVLAGCGSKHAVSLGPPPRQTTSGSDVTGTLPSSRSFQTWFVRGGRLVPELRTHAPTPRVATAALEALLAGPTPAERAAGISTAIPPGTRLIGVSIKDGVAAVDLTSEYQSGGGSRALQLRLGQVVYTMTEFPTVRAVRFALDGAPVKVFSSAGIVLDHPVGRSAYAALSSIAPPLAGAWRSLPAAPVAGLATPVSVWTGKRMLVFGGARRDVVAAYDPSTNAWQRLPTPLKPIGSPSAVWTGKEILIWGRGVAEAFHPGTKRWRLLPRPPFAGAPAVVAWTGGELLGLNADLSGGAAYSPASNAWRKLAPSPLAGSRQAAGAWTGRELLVLGAGTRAAAYDRTTDTWRSLAPLPALRDGANAVWDGRELLVVGGSASRAGRLPAEGFAYDLATNRWRPLPPMESGRLRAAAVWTGKRLLLWGGGTGGAGSLVIPPHGLAYDPRTDRWSPLPQAPLLGRLDPTAVWTGRALIVWGGETRAARRLFADGAAFRPAKP